jgi:ATP-binding protein involved in chromosome partitioning
METNTDKTDSKIPVSAKSIIAVASGKGGVGKSTVTTNLALALAKMNLKVGLLDADIYGPNIPLMLGFKNELATVKETRIIPSEKFGLKVISMAFIAPADQALIWRGPLAHKLIEQLLRDVEWGELDILIIDLPPGTGDVPISIVQKTKLSGSIIVSTPQEASLADVRKMINMFKTTQTPILGLVENMKYLICPDCQKKIELFPNADSRDISEKLEIPLLLEVPFFPHIGLKDNHDTPAILTGDSNTNPIYSLYHQLAKKLIESQNLNC